MLRTINKIFVLNIRMDTDTIINKLSELDLPYERTAKSKAPSFTKNFLQEHPHPIVNKIAKAREINKAHTTFIDTIIKYLN